MSRVVYIPNQILAPIIAVLCVLGALVAKNYVFDIWIMVALGIFAFLSVRNGYPIVPMILGFILAEIIEGNFHLALGVGFGSYSVFFVRPISLVMIIITVSFITWPWIVDAIRKKRLASGKSIEALDAITDKEVDEIGVGELVFGGFVALFLAIFLVTAYRYRADIRLFPVIVCYTGLILCACWFFNVIRNKKIVPLTFAEFALKKKGMHWLLAAALLVGYALFVPVIGFIVASLIYFVVTAVLAGYKRWLPLAVTTAGVGIFLLLAARFLQIDMPVGWLLK